MPQFICSIIIPSSARLHTGLKENVQVTAEYHHDVMVHM